MRLGSSITKIYKQYIKCIGLFAVRLKWKLRSIAKLTWDSSSTSSEKTFSLTLQVKSHLPRYSQLTGLVLLVVAGIPVLLFANPFVAIGLLFQTLAAIGLLAHPDLCMLMSCLWTINSFIIV